MRIADLKTHVLEAPLSEPFNWSFIGTSVRASCAPGAGGGIGCESSPSPHSPPAVLNARVPAGGPARLGCSAGRGQRSAAPGRARGLRQRHATPDAPLPSSPTRFFVPGRFT
jgi:hypothetical protein